MAINKNFVVKNGFEVATNLVYADSDLYNVGIGSTIPRTLLDVRGGIAATDFSASGISTFLGEVNIGIDGASNTFIDGKSGFGTDNPHYLVHINSPVSTGQTALYVRGDMVVTGDINLDDLNIDVLNANDVTTGTLTGTIATITTLDGDLADFVNLSTNVGIVTTLRGTNLSYSGVGTIANIDNVNIDVSGIATIATLNATTVVISGVAGSVGKFTNFYSESSYIDVGIVTTLRGTNLSYSGIGTIGTLDGTTADFNTIYANVGIITTLRGTNLSYSGIGTIGTLDGTTADFTNLYANTGIVTTLRGTNLSYSGIGTIGTLDGTTADFVDLSANTGIITTLRGTNLSYSGIGTIGTLDGTTADFTNLYANTGVVTSLTGTTATITNIRGTNLNISGIATIGSIPQVNATNIVGTNLNISGIATIGSIPQVNSTNLNVSGIATIGNVKIATGFVTAVSGVLTYYGDGSKLSNVIGGVGLATVGGVVGYGATILEFRGAGISTITVGSGIGTVNITGGSTTITKESFTVSSSTQSIFNLSDTYESGYIDVFLNGVRLSSTDFTESGSNQITLVSAAVNGDIVDFVNYKVVLVGIVTSTYATTAFGLSGSPNIVVTNVNSSGIVTATSFDSGGTSSQFVKGDGSLDSNLYASTGKAIAMAMVFG